MSVYRCNRQGNSCLLRNPNNSFWRRPFLTGVFFPVAVMLREGDLMPDLFAVVYWFRRERDRAKSAKKPVWTGLERGRQIAGTVVKGTRGMGLQHNHSWAGRLPPTPRPPFFVVGLYDPHPLTDLTTGDIWEHSLAPYSVAVRHQRPFEA